MDINLEPNLAIKVVWFILTDLLRHILFLTLGSFGAFEYYTYQRR